MKHVKIIRIFALAVVLSLLLLMLPVLPAMAVNDISLSPTSGQVGDLVYVYGQNYTAYVPAAPYEYYVQVYFAKDSVSINTSFTAYVHTYQLVESYVSIDDTGYFEASFSVPASLTDGTVDENVVSGTYYVYITIVRYNTDTAEETVYNIIKSKATFTVSGTGTLDPLAPASGPAGTDVTVSGSGFAVSSAITFKFDTTTLTIKSGSTQTTIGGMFLSTITIPADATAGTHTIYVTVSGVTKSATFTVTASASLDPLSPTSGAAGTDVDISGANFPASTALVFKFDTTVITPKSGDAATRSSGIFISTITVPASATAGAHTITVTAGSATATATFTVTAAAALNPISPTSGPAGTDVTVSGANFMVSYPIIFQLDSTTLTPKSGDTSTTTSGSFNSIITIPAGTTAGAHTISVTIGTVTLTATFTVTGAPTPTPTNAVLAVATSGANIGAQIAINGAGFTPGADVTFKYDNTMVATTKADINGMISDSFIAPPSVHGEHIITVSDGTHTATTTFTVESTPPPVPAALAPENGAKVEMPITFDWQDVTDVSMPVTYDLQIATDETFTASSIVLEKNGLNASEFILSEMGELAAGDEVAYYWRVRAVDAAQNESAWNTINDFYSSGPSSFPTWAIIVIGVVGGLFLLIAGFWLGRRTAFYY